MKDLQVFPKQMMINRSQSLTPTALEEGRQGMPSLSFETKSAVATGSFCKLTMAVTKITKKEEKKYADILFPIQKQTTF